MNEKMIKELLEKVKTPEEAVALAKEHGVELALEQAKALLDRVKNAVSGELSDEDLGVVAGGKIEMAGEDILAQAMSIFGQK